MTKILIQLKKIYQSFFAAEEKKSKMWHLMYKAAEYSNKEQMKIHRKAMEMSTV